ncbi:hypothetical protein CLIB1423_10S01354 [[Candida] railenensis]|uniref:BHLH domain-containing protein n=1 Tax=[Candida] railenensis TaxID=45579 RepID=A0A9P0QPU8_9ASCO|nr:hypothetical protein CLIB1423_10S01354 [[Candida] railenensis]
MMEDWARTFSPPDRSSAIFFQELGELGSAAAITPNHPSAVVGAPAVGNSAGSAVSAASGESNTHTPNNFSEQDQFFLQQIENNLYDSNAGTPHMIKSGHTPQDQLHLQQQRQIHNSLGHQHRHQDVSQHHHHHHSSDISNPSSNSGSNPPTSTSTGAADMGLDNLNFILAEELHYENGHTLPSSHTHQSTAYPPSVHPPPHTPNMQALKNKSAIDKRVAAASSNSTSGGASGGKGRSSGFASPVLPSQNDKSYNDQHLYHKSQHHNHSHRNSLEGSIQHPPAQHVRPDAVFTPLVSPAVTPLESQVNLNKSQHHHHHQQSQSSGSGFVPPVSTVFEPLTSPALTAQQSDKRRPSSSMYAPHGEEKSSQSSNKRKTPHGTPILQATNGSNRSKQSPVVNAISALSSTFDKLPEASVDSNKSSLESTPMLPPQGKKVDIKRETPAAQMMGFTMGRLAEQQSSDANSSFDSPTMNGMNGGTVEGPRSTKKFSYNSKILPKTTSSSSETSPILSGSNDGLAEQKSGGIGSRGRTDKTQPTKKASHKVAEQGRRNRMNVAIHELASLIPKKYHDEVSIPSKATTVELASKYINDLLEELGKSHD